MQELVSNKKKMSENCQLNLMFFCDFQFWTHPSESGDLNITTHTILIRSYYYTMNSALTMNQFTSTQFRFHESVLHTSVSTTISSSLMIHVTTSFQFAFENNSQYLFGWHKCIYVHLSCWNRGICSFSRVHRCEGSSDPARKIGDRKTAISPPCTLRKRKR